MRTKYSLINVTTGIGSQLLITLLSFVSRTVFIGSLGVEYLGINGLFSNILGMLALAEAGIGTSIVYALYKPVAEQRIRQINLLMRLYRNAFRIIACVITGLGLSLIPFLGFFIGDTDVDSILLIYLLFLASTVSSYFFAHKLAILNVNQQGYIVTGVFTLSSIASTLVKIGVLYFFSNFIAYLVVEIAFAWMASLALALIANRKFPYLKNKVTGKLDAETKAGLVKNIKALVLHNIGGYCIFGTDNLIISAFVSVTAVGLYSNYYMLINICRTFINQVFNNITHSVGNLVAVESKDNVYKVFQVAYLINFWIYSLFSIVLYIIIEPFISLWLGDEFLLPHSLLLIVLINFFVSGMRRSISIVKTTSGIYHPDRYAPFAEAAINLVFSIVLVQQYGITGVFVGTLISTLAVPFWVAPYLVYRNVFEKPLWTYFTTFMLYSTVGLIACMAAIFAGNLYDGAPIPALGAKLFSAVVIPNLIYIAAFGRTEAFRYVLNTVLGLGKKLLTRTS